MGKKRHGRRSSGGRSRSSGGGKSRRRRRGGDGSGRRGGDGNHDSADFKNAPIEPGYGLLELHPNGYGFLRSPQNIYSRERSDPFVPGTMIEKYDLREGVLIRGTVQQARKQQGPRLREVLDVDGLPPEEYANVKNFE